jgi:drug/metabolite transporter (DMT)-like permease
VRNRHRLYIVKSLILTILALIALAANSVLCRMALGEDRIDASSFTVIRLLSGVLVLLAIVKITNRKKSLSSRGSWFASMMLFLYAISFSFAYMTLDTGTGAFILFGAVQITMISISFFSGNRLHLSEWIGVSIAFMGFVYLVLPGITAPSAIGFILMSVAGIAWGIYTLKGRGSDAPLLDTSSNFLRTVPFVIVLSITAVNTAQYSIEGILLAVLSGGIASGIGYTIWYSALGGLSTTQAAVVQLSVPMIAALGGVIFLSETLTQRLTVSALMILGGILLVVLGRYYFVQARLNTKI